MGIWTEDLRPSSLDELLMSRETRQKIQDWIASWESGTPKKRGLLLYGTPGLGKTSAAIAISKSKGWNILEVNSSDFRSEKFLNMTAGMFAMYRDLDSFADPSPKRKIDKMVLVDEADNIFERGGAGKERGGYVAIRDTLRETKIPVVITMNEYWEFYRKSTAKDIISLCEVVEYTIYKKRNDLDYRNALDTITDRIISKCNSEGIKTSRSSIESIVKSNLPDLRGAVNDSYSYALSQGGSMQSDRDRKTETFSVIRDVLKKPDYESNLRSIRESDIDKDTLVQWLNTNAPKECVTIDALNSVEEYISLIDLLSRKVSRRYLDELSAATFSKVDKQGGYTKYDFPTYLSTMSRSKKSRSSIKRVVRAMEISLHISETDAIESRPYFREMSSYAGGLADELSSSLTDKSLMELRHSNMSPKRKKFDPPMPEDLDIYLSTE